MIPTNSNIHFARLKTVVSTAILLGATAALNGCHRDAQVPAKPSVAVRLADVTLYESTEGLRYSASITPYTQVDLAFRTGGYVTEVKQIKSADGRARSIDIGDYVTAGTVLAQIRPQDLRNQADQSEAQVNAAIAQHTLAEQEFNRAKALYATQSLTKPDYDQAQARFDATLASVNQASASLREAHISLSDSSLKAPLSGRILTRNVDVGTLASPSAPAFTIADISEVKASFGVPEGALNLVHLGQQLTLQMQNDTALYVGHVTSISSSADSKNRVFTVEVTLPNRRNQLRPGMIASIELGGKHEQPQPSVPLSAVVPYLGSTGEFAVFVAQRRGDKWQARTQHVTVGVSHGSSVSVSGVQVGEKVVAIGAQLLKDGDSLSVIP